MGLPVYNGQRYLAQAVESLLAQTFGDFELVLCDNASTDETESIGRDLEKRDGRVRYYRNERNLGAAPNFNRAWSLCAGRGRYFKWAAHDDLYAPTYLEKCVAVLEEEPSAVLCHSRTVIIDEAGEELWPPRRSESRSESRGETRHGHGSGNGQSVFWEDVYEKPRRLDSPRPHERFMQVLLATRRCFEIFGVMRAEAMAKTHGHESYYGADKVVLSALSLMGRLVEVPEALFFRRHHGGTSGSIRTARDREAWVASGGGRRSNGGAAALASPFVPRLRCLRGYCRSVAEADLGWRDRTGCAVAVARYLLQPDRWVAVLREPR
jgi:glycosyltransferase involved in cell wall biosynthesis